MSIKLTWNPTRSGKPLAAADIDRYELRMKVDGAPGFSPIPAPEPGDVEYVLDIVDPGTYTFQQIMYPKVGPASDPVEGSTTIADTSKPVIQDFTVTVV